MARSSRRGRNKKVNSTPIIIGILGILVAVLACMLFFKPEARSDAPKPFNISQYRQDGSRFASTGNRYVLEGKVVNGCLHLESWTQTLRNCAEWRYQCSSTKLD